ncbi:MAG: formylglycine-generating enzyme family protein [Planctomycetaceae bacterium]|nr:formylglycine-generating enzyme family protein [Planctomycetaceae bacterium]
MKLVLIRAGDFLMGSPETEIDRDSDEEPVHPVRLSNYYMSECLVTQKQFESVLGHNYSIFKNPANPVEMVTKTEADTFCRKLSEMEGRNYSLPSEAQWEYACRAGSYFSYSYGNDVEQLKDFAWFKQNSDNHTHPVGTKKNNSFGLYDMHGNVWEWCLDKWQEAGYDPEDKIDPICTKGYIFVIRGGSYLNEPQALRCAKRFGYNNQRNSTVGFRVILKR